MIKRAILILSVLFVLYWIARIITINRSDSAGIVCYEMNETVTLGDIDVTVVKAGLFSPEEYYNIFGVKPDDVSEKDKILTIRIHVVNTSDYPMEWNSLSAEQGKGFVSGVWQSSIWPYYTVGVNKVYSDKFYPGDEVDVILATSVQKVLFKDKNWNRIEDRQFFFVVSYYPQAIRVKLDFSGVNNEF